MPAPHPVHARLSPSACSRIAAISSAGQLDRIGLCAAGDERFLDNQRELLAGQAVSAQRRDPQFATQVLHPGDARGGGCRRVAGQDLRHLVIAPQGRTVRLGPLQSTHVRSIT